MEMKSDLKQVKDLVKEYLQIRVFLPEKTAKAKTITHTQTWGSFVGGTKRGRKVVRVDYFVGHCENYE